MLEFYPQVRSVHIAAVMASGALFTVRGIGTLARQAWPQAALARWSSYAIDTVLLTAALMLVTMLPSAMFANGWLTMKLLLLVLYIVAGSMALKRSRTPQVRALWFAAAVLLYAGMFGVARLHHPLGWGLLLKPG
jgi:uncharacterized membrane protein SirB2